MPVHDKEIVGCPILLELKMTLSRYGHILEGFLKEAMKNSKQSEQPEPAFTMDENDRFYSIIVSDPPIHYDVEPDAETILTFFAVRRASGTIDVFNVMKTFKNKTCISRNIQSKLNIPPDKISSEIQAIIHYFAEGIRKKTNFKICWSHLNLSRVDDRDEQIKRIQVWNKVNVYNPIDFSFN